MTVTRQLQHPLFMARTVHCRHLPSVGKALRKGSGCAFATVSEDLGFVPPDTVLEEREWVSLAKRMNASAVLCRLYLVRV